MNNQTQMFPPPHSLLYNWQTVNQVSKEIKRKLIIKMNLDKIKKRNSNFPFEFKDKLKL